MSVIQDSIIQKHGFEKVAQSFSLSKNVKNWKEEIMKNFSKQVEANVKGIQFDLEISNVDQNKGYGSGSVRESDSIATPW